MNVEAVEWAFEQPIVRSVDKLLLLTLARHADEDGCVGMSLSRLHEETALDRKSILPALQRLSAGGWIGITEGRSGATGRVPVYRLRGFRNRKIATQDINATQRYANRGISNEPVYGQERSQERYYSCSDLGSLEPRQKIPIGPNTEPNGPKNGQEWTQIRTETGPFLGSFPIVLSTLSFLGTEDILFSHIPAAEVPRADVGSQASLLPPDPPPPAPKPERASKARPRVRIAADREPDDADRAAATKAGVDLTAEWPRFRDHHVAKGSVMADWHAAWRTWCGNSHRFNGNGRSALPEGLHGLRTQL